MLAIGVEFLMDRYFSACFEEGDRKLRAEWPPHPVRLYRALTSALFESPLAAAPGRYRDALEWMGAQNPPSVHAPELTQEPAETVGTFVPVNDDKAVKANGAIELLAMRARKERRFPAVSPPTNRVFFHWPNAQPSAEHLSALGGLMRFVGYLGNSRSLVSVWFSEDIPGELECWEPDEQGDYRLRIATAGALRDLEGRAMHFHATGLKAYRPGSGKWTGYKLKSKTRSEPAAANNYSALLPLELRTGLFTLEAAGLLCARWKAALTEKTAGTYGDLQAPGFLTGHVPGEIDRPAKENHVVAVPLAHVGFQFADGRVLGLGILLPKGLTPAQETECYRAIQSIDHLNLGQFGVAEVGPVSIEESRLALDSRLWTRESRCWATVTPFVFHRYPKKATDAEALVQEACAFAGLPKPKAAVAAGNSPFRGVPLSSRFRPREDPGGRPRRFHQHVFLEFDEPIKGPLMMGAGQAYGYGFFRPC